MPFRSGKGRGRSSSSSRRKEKEQEEVVGGLLASNEGRVGGGGVLVPVPK